MSAKNLPEIVSVDDLTGWLNGLYRLGEFPERDLIAEPLTVAELTELCTASIADMQAELEAFEEQHAIAVEGGKSADRRAFEVLERDERFAGEHECARQYLKSSKTARNWKRKVAGA